MTKQNRDKREQQPSPDRASNQGRKNSTGGLIDKSKGDPELDDDTKSPVRDENKREPKARGGLKDETDMRDDIEGEDSIRKPNR